MASQMKRTKFASLSLQVVENGKVIDTLSVPDPRIAYCKAYKRWFPNRTIYPVSRVTPDVKGKRAGK